MTDSPKRESLLTKDQRVQLRNQFGTVIWCRVHHYTKTRVYLEQCDDDPQMSHPAGYTCWMSRRDFNIAKRTRPL